MTRQRTTMRSLRQRFDRARTRRKDRQRQRHLKRLVQCMRLKLKRAYPDGQIPDHASATLTDGDELVQAIQRYEHGDYGNCQDCGNPIPLLELWAQPQRRHCRNCMTEHGQPPGRRMRFVL